VAKNSNEDIEGSKKDIKEYIGGWLDKQPSIPAPYLESKTMLDQETPNRPDVLVY
jgi:hypothetical protein